MIKSLAYVGLGVADIGAWYDTAVSVFGLAAGTPAPDGSPRLRTDGIAWRIALHRSDQDDVQYAGFDVADAVAADRLATRLAEIGVGTRAMTPDEVASRGVRGGLRCSDPDGLAVELVYGLDASSSPFSSDLGTQFVTGGLGLGHLVVTTADADRSLAFYRCLGMQLSDYITVPLGPIPEVTITFLHCNERHHTLALLPLPGPKRLNHLMLEVDSTDEVIRAYYRALRRGLPVVRHLGRHSNDLSFSFYARTPAGFDIELGCNGLHVGPEWQVRHYRSISTWGHEDA
jgi:biphenyl-2,3-diol 1,2-dioxygenase